MQFRLRSDLPIEMLPDGTVIAHVIWYEDDADPLADGPKLIDQVRLPYWFVYQTDEEREAYLLATIKARHEELMRTEQMRKTAPIPSRLQELVHGVHRVTPEGEVVVRRHVVQEMKVNPQADLKRVPEQKEHA